MILGLGIDLVAVERIQRALVRHGDGFAQRILAPDEVPDFIAQNRSARFLAKRFATKEALAKALGTGIRGAVGWHEIRTVHDSLGAPRLALTEKLEAYCRERGIRRTHLTVSDEKTHAVACVILEGDS